MRAVIKPSVAKGKINAPTSKSIAHRLLLAASLSEEKSVISGITRSEDVLATIDCIRTLGAIVSENGNTYTVIGKDMREAAPSGLLYCRESGSTLRFIIPIAALSGAKALFSGTEKLLSRPLSVYEKIFEERELLLKKAGNVLIVDGPLPSGEYLIDGNVSSQFITGLLFALPLTDSDSIIRINPPFASKSYVDLTIDALEKFGVKAYFEDALTIRIPGGQTYNGTVTEVEGDYSGAAFLEALNLFGSKLEVLGLNDASKQGDKAYREFYKLLRDSTPEIDIENCPDLAPILFTVAAEYNGAVFKSTSRLKIKESDRAEAMAIELRKFGADIEIFEDSVVVKKTALHTPKETLCSHNDHRVVMSLAVLSTKYGGTIDGVEAVNKSYPGFFSDIKNAGIEVEV
ncbi:MAG: 3-phosphoshikimate 1-carboxyvinyltransferase [Ruminococcaceae bacterium]|nr:3-phosphoshikimate 1-carboxyvinyltransferase [Oscillospiraceae bacterium]